MRRFALVCCLLATPALADNLTLRSWPDDPNVIQVRKDTDISYEMLARQPQKYLANFIAVQGKIVQALDDGAGDGVLRLNVTPDRNFKFFTDTVWVDLHRTGPGGYRFLDGDVVGFSGEFVGLKSYSAVSGATIQIPRIKADAAAVYLLKQQP